MLYEFIDAHRDEIIVACRAKVGLRRVPSPAEAELEFGVPLFLDQLIAALRMPGTSIADMHHTAVLNGRDLRRLGVTVAQVVHSYGDVCQAVTELAVELGAPISADEFRTFNSCTDHAIASAVTEFELSRDQSVADDTLDRENTRYGFFAHELRNLLNSASLSFDALRTGTVGVGGSTGAILERSLRGMHGLIDRTLAEVRASAGMPNPERIVVAEFIEGLEIAAVLEAQSRGLRLTVSPGDTDAAIDVDRMTLTSVVTNLIQNAMKFSQADGLVSVVVQSTSERVRIQVRDECGGLPSGRAEELFRPFEQRSGDRSGLGLGLAIAYEGVKANGGTIQVADLPGTGCVFTIDFPRVS